MTSAFNNHNTRIKTLEEDKLLLLDSVKGIENRLDLIEQASLINSVEITNIPLLDNEDTVAIILTICDSLNTGISKDDILSYHRKKFGSIKDSTNSRPPQ